MPTNKPFPPINTNGYTLSLGGILFRPSKETLGVETEDPMSVYLREGESPYYQMAVTLPNGRLIRKSTKSSNKEDAERFEKAFRSSRGLSHPVFEKPQSISYKELWAKCLIHWG